MTAAAGTPGRLPRGRSARLLLTLAVLHATATASSADVSRGAAHQTGSGAPARTVRFLGADPVGPLAEIRGGVIATPAASACRSWGPIGSRWHELDRFGRVAGVAVVAQREYYEPSRCDELHMRRSGGTSGVGVFVDASAGYRAPHVEPWQPDAGERSALEELVRLRQRDITDLDPAHAVPFDRRVLFFAWKASGERYAVAGGKSLIVLALRAGRWDVVHEDKPKTMRARQDGCAALLVTDMNGDGRPEIVVHAKEEQGEWYGDFTLSLDAGGLWRKIAAGIFGSTG